MAEQQKGEKLVTNYSEGYKESKPFDFRGRGKTTTVYRQQDVVEPPSPEVSVKESTRGGHFLRRLR